MQNFFSIIIVCALVGLRCASGIDIGVCFGMNANNLPSPSDVISLYKQYGIDKIRLFEPNLTVLEALRGKRIDVALGVRNEDTRKLANDPSAALAWFNTFVAPFLSDMVFQYIAVGNEVVPFEFSQYIAPAMLNIQRILDDRSLDGVSVTTAVFAGAVLGASFPPSSGAFSDQALPDMHNILEFLSAQGSPLMINAYPYFAYAKDQANVPLEYALFTSNATVVQDNGLSYTNLLDAEIDSYYSAMERMNFPDVGIAVSESGWPSSGNGQLTTPDLAATYNRNFINHIMHNGTPKRPNAYIEGYVFSMFDENLKPKGIEQHWGLFNPKSRKPVYSVFS